MIVIERKQYVIDIHNAASEYIRTLRNAMTRNSSYIDVGYIESTIDELGLFAALIRVDCLNDMQLLHKDVAIARQVRDGNETFGDYCYDSLLDAYRATNDCIAASNDLVHKLQDELGDEVDISAASNYIGFNIFGKGTQLELTNFGRMTGVGLKYVIRVKAPMIQQTNVNLDIDKSLSSFCSISDIIGALRGKAKLHDIIDEWSSVVNDKLYDRKVNGMAAWTMTYEAVKDKLLNTEFYKINTDTYCTLIAGKNKFTEVLTKHGHVKKIDYRTDYMTVLMLDYINNRNFDFR